jgi:hypothetical protein
VLELYAAFVDDMPLALERIGDVLGRDRSEQLSFLSGFAG